MKTEKEEKRAEAERLFKAAEFKWESFNDNLHWRVEGIEFYPTTWKWFDQKNEFKDHGIENLIRYIQTRPNKKHDSVKILTVEQVFEVAKRSPDKSLFGICTSIHKSIYL